MRSLGNIAVWFAVLRGVYYWRRTSVLKDDSGRAVAWAYGDGEHDDTRHLQRGIDRSTILHIPAATHRISRPLIVRNMALIGDGTERAAAIRMDP